MKFKSPFLHEAQWRGFVYQGTNLQALDALMAKQKITAYIGFDATAPSLHVGNLIQILRLRLLQKHGHRPIVLMGDGTTRIGDPSGKDDMRRLLSEDQIESNVKSIQAIFKNYLTFGQGPSDAILRRNSAWLMDLKYINFLRDYGHHFTINRMLTFESVKGRLDREQPLSLIEFNYMIFQAYDFLQLYRHENCLLQLGGSDQWGNIVAGADLIRRVTGQIAHGLTGSLITTSDGKKMGKTAQGAVWLNPDHLSPFDFWQFWRNTQDADVGKFLRLFTDLERDEISRLDGLKGQDLNQAKIILADEATQLCHGKDAVRAIKAGHGSKTSTLRADQSHLPTLRMKSHERISILKALCDLGFTASKGEARRLIRGGGVRVNNNPLGNEDDHIEQPTDGQDTVLIQAGKKRQGRIVFSK